MTPEAFAQKINEWGRGTMIERHGTRFVTAGKGRAVAQIDFKPELTQLTGRFHAGAIVALADEAATAAAMWETNPTGDFRPELFPLSLQLSVNLIRNTNRGRTILVVDVQVFDDERALVAKLVATLLAPRAA